MKKGHNNKLRLHRETLRQLDAKDLAVALGGKNSFDITLGGQALGCPSECCTTFDH